ncbi:MAG: hypothetical protein LBS26_05930 [Campylobacteraceae bacterium]|jgi:hypothetical protein|nr:hypothetical protein [Campylobacteraceae bacterium]
MAEEYFGDLAKTEILTKLFDAEHSKRDGSWVNEFFANVIDASFRCDEAQIMRGPDGFLYFKLITPEPNQPFTCYVLRHMMPQFLLKEGFGAVINPQKGNPDWVFSYGDLMGYYVNGAFLSHDKRFDTGREETEVLEKEENILIGNPSENILPALSREFLHNFCKQLKLPAKVALMKRKSKNNGDDEGFFSLVFPFTPKMFRKEEEFRQFLKMFSWYFPRFYSVICLEERGDFYDLI